MKKYISILRGINVSGQKLIRMTELAELYKELGFTAVKTFIQSGNVLFMADEDFPAGQLSGLIEKAILERFGFDVPVIIRSYDELGKTITCNPFIDEQGIDRTKLHVTFLSDHPADENLTVIHPLNYLPDRFFLNGRDIYVYCPAGYGNTRLSNNFFENRLKVKATTRNWNTVIKLSEMLKEI